MPVADCFHFFGNIELSSYDREVAQRILIEIKNRLRFLCEVGLGYLTLNRLSNTLSGGESQRIRLASQIGSGLVGVLYILDEPSIGLHQRDNTRLIETLKRLRDIGNSVIVVEHDEEAIKHADHVLDMGLGAGIHGGRVIAEGTAAEVSAHAESLTGQYLSGRRKIAVPALRHPVNDKRQLVVQGATGNNLKNVTVGIPVGLFVCVTGVSGSGKSTLINDTLYTAAARHLYGSTAEPAAHNAIKEIMAESVSETLLRMELTGMRMKLPPLASRFLVVLAFAGSDFLGRTVGATGLRAVSKVIALLLAASFAGAAEPDKDALYKKFEQSMSGVKLVGQFTVLGQKTDKLTKEEYSILSAEKVGELWLLKTRIKYGNTDKTVPLPIPVKWAGTTPVISLDNFTLSIKSLPAIS